jgi:hypothetical protein
MDWLANRQQVGRFEAPSAGHVVKALHGDDTHPLLLP